MPNIEGRRCERCRENMHNREQGCVDCPPCYGLVQDIVNIHRSKLNSLRNLLDEIASKPTEVEDNTFEAQLQELLDRINQLTEEVRRLGGEEQALLTDLLEMKNRLANVWSMTHQIENRLGELGSMVSRGKNNMTQAENLIIRVESTYLTAKRTYETEGRNALQKARERFARFGQQSTRMTQISREAMALAQKHIEDANRIEQLVKEALNNSETAYNLVKEAVGIHSSNREELLRVEEQVKKTKDLLERTEKASNDAFLEATRVREEAIRLLTDAKSINFPFIDAAKIKAEANNLIEQARLIMQDAEKLLSRYTNVLAGTQIELADLRVLLQKAIDQQAETARLLLIVEASLNSAKDAASSANSTLLQAQNTLTTLEQFDTSVQRSRDAARDSMNKIPAIRELIQNADARTEQSMQALLQAQKDALNAKDAAKDAKVIAESAAEDAKRIRDDAELTRKRAQKMRADSDALNATVIENEQRIYKLEIKSENDGKLAQEIGERANQAKTSADEARRKIKMAMEMINQINQALQALGPVDAAQLAELEKRLREAEEELRSADLNNRTDALIKARDRQKAMIDNIANDLDFLRAEVANIKAISEAIPKDCLRRMRLEP